VLSYRVTLDVPVQLVLFVSGLLADRRREIGTRRWPRLAVSRCGCPACWPGSTHDLTARI